MLVEVNRSNRFRTLAIFISLMWVVTVHAEPLDEEEARNAVIAFFSPSTTGRRLRAKGQQLILRSKGHEAGYYIFDRPEGGAVFVADDDAIGRTVLGYTDQGSYDPEHLPIGLQDWMQQVTVLMNAVHEGKIVQTQVVRRAEERTVPLIQTHWDQHDPYNRLCPSLGGQRCITGCVATAMAQVMYYWQWPERGNGTVSCKDPATGQPLSVNLSGHKYDWINMLGEYNTGQFSSEQATAVATLMRDCGYAVDMRYTPSESNASISARHMQKYFMYSPLAKDRNAPDYSVDMWHEYIQEDLLAGRPVLYNGQSTTSGHEFILDGFNKSGYYHVNWGWSGHQDGWFTLTNLNGYNSDQWMINHLEPDYAGGGTPVSFTYSVNEEGTLKINGKGMMPDEYAMETAPWRELSSEIKKIVIGEGITSIVENFGYAWLAGNSYSFENLEEVVLPEGLQYIGWSAFPYTYNLTSVQLPSTVAVMDDAFMGSNITSLHLPKSLEEYTDYLPNLAEISVDEANPKLTVMDNILYNKDYSVLYLIPAKIDHITIAETTEGILDEELFDLGVPILSKATTAPTLPTNIKYYIGNRGTLFYPYESKGYDSWKKLLPEGWQVLPYTDIAHIPENKITWSQSDGTLMLSGWGGLEWNEYGSDNAPYYENRAQLVKLIVNEGITRLCENAFCWYQFTDVELPSTLFYLGTFCFQNSRITTITSHSLQAPRLGNYVFSALPQNGKLRVPEGADYSAWLAQLPSGWAIEYIEPQPLATCHLYTGEIKPVYDLEGWESVLSQAPNTVGILSPGREQWAYFTRNMLLQDAEVETGYRCPYFRLTDFASSYSNTNKAATTGFVPPVAFTITRGSYTRNLREGYNTICMPFPVSEEELPEGCRMYAYSTFDRDKHDVIFTRQIATEAGHVGFVTCETNVAWHQDLSGATITTLSPFMQDAHMQGTFVSTDAYQGIGYNPRTNDNIFAPLEKYLHPFRACFLIDTPAATQLRLRLMGDADGIGDVENEKDKGLLKEDVLYTLDGKRLVVPLKGKPFIKNGKIVIR